MDTYDNEAIKAWALEKMLEAFADWRSGGSIIPLLERVRLAESAGVAPACLDYMLRASDRPAPVDLRRD